MFKSVKETDIGLKSGTCTDFINRIADKKINLHSLILIKDGKIFLEEYAPEYNSSYKHRLYSVSKTFVSAAIGVAIGEGLISLDSEIVSYFKDKCGKKIHPYIKALTVRDCLIMATPFDCTSYNNKHEDWLCDIFTDTSTHRGGTIFHYDTGATHILCALIERVTGKPFNEYLFEKVLCHIGYESVPECVEAPEGTKWGGSGLLCTSREFASFACLIANAGKGENGIQLIPKEYVSEMTSKQIGNNEDNRQISCYGHGYGYQMWLTKLGPAMLGMGNQLAIICPETKTILICTGDDQGNDYAREHIFNLYEELILKPLGYNGIISKREALGMPVLEGEHFSPLQEKFSGKRYKLLKSDTGIEEISFTFGKDKCTMDYYARGENKQIIFGLGKYIEGKLPEKEYSGMRINKPSYEPYRCFAEAVWDEPDLLVLKCYAADNYFGHFMVNIRFSEIGIDMHFTKKAEWFFTEYDGFVTGNTVDLSKDL